MQISISQPNDDEPEFEEVDEDLRREIIENPGAFTRVLNEPEIQQIVVSHEAFQGPLPHPYILKGYNEILPGAADRVFKLTEGEFAHRHDMEKKALNGAIERDKRGQHYGLAATIFTLVCATILGLTGHEILAGSIVATIVAIAAIFVLRSKPASHKKEEKSQEQSEEKETEAPNNQEPRDNT